MNIQISVAKPNDDKECLNCARESQLWDAYFDEVTSLEMIQKFIEKEQVYIAHDESNKCVGFMGLIKNGGFGKFPYLAILSVRAEYRSMGIGKKLLDRFEELGFQQDNRLLVLCSDFNIRGQNFYKMNGYIECGRIDDLFKKGIAEHLFVKYQEN